MSNRRAAANVPRTPNRGHSLQRSRDVYNKRVDESVQKLLESFGNILRSGQVREGVTNSRENLDIAVHTASLINAGESLIEVVQELNHLTVLNDQGLVDQAVLAKRGMYTHEYNKREKALSSLSKEIDLAVTELEKGLIEGRLRIDAAKNAHTHNNTAAKLEQECLDDDGPSVDDR
eukprot:TRINITY_DN512_c0_g2_i1.p1 TRINITY_DN512_c0_g2~~TRINITY_DN512_c0_g2_i1.p1  ORF type:complete len:176 (-),score=36.02 TRINITY_DN512_c0_g2_i1:41-568(-)